MAAKVEAGALVDDVSPYGTYSLSSFLLSWLKVNHALPVHYIFRRLGLWLRKLVFWKVPRITDVKVGDLSLRLYPWDNVTERQFLFLPQFIDAWEQDFIKKHLPPEGTFIDLGANVGIYTLWALGVLNKDGRVLACEPHPAMRHRLLYNLSLNPHPAQIDVFSEATSDKKGMATLSFDPLNWGGSSLLKQGESKNSLKVKTELFLTLLQKANVSKIHILKADIEGVEDITLIPFFNEAPQALWPQHVIIENSRKEWKHDLVPFLQKLGYDLVRTTRINITMSMKS